VLNYRMNFCDLLNLTVSSITWLENNVFLTVSTPSNFDSNTAPEEIKFHVITREPPSGYMFQKIADPAMPYGLPRHPPHHFLLRLKDFPPHLQDLLIVASSASTDIGLFSRSKTPLAADKPSDKVVGVFTMTEAIDSRRAQLPMTIDSADTSPIGVVLDLSSREKVVRPIPTDEMDESPTPMPSLMVLNNEGALSSWWVVYSESVKQGTMYPGLVAAGQSPQSLSSASTQPKSAFGGLPSNTMAAQPTFGASATPLPVMSGFKQPTPSTFGAPSGLGSNPSGVFGTPSVQAPSPWAQTTSASTGNTAATFGSPAFGSTSAPNAQGLAFGASALPGNRASPWTTMTTKGPGAAFGQPTSISSTPTSTFGSGLGGGGGVFGSGAIPSSGGFASFANKNGFAAAAAAQGSNGTSIFAAKPTSEGFAAPVSSSGMETSTSFGGNTSIAPEKLGGLFGSGGFKLGSTFKPDGTAENGGPKPSTSNSFFGTGFGEALAAPQKSLFTATPTTVDADMDADVPETSQTESRAVVSESKKPGFSAPVPPTSTTPTSTPAATKFQFPDVSPPVKTGLFGTDPPLGGPITKHDTSKSTNFSFGSTPAIDNKQETTIPGKVAIPNILPATPEAPRFKQEPISDSEVESTLKDIPEAPLPPDSTSKSSYPAGDSSVSSIEPEAPLPPDFLSTVASKNVAELPLPSPETKDKKSTLSDMVASSDVPDGPEEDDESGFETEDENYESEGLSEEGSGEDVVKDVSPTSDLHQTPGFTPQSSFGAGTDGDRFTKISRPAQDINARSLFGEIAGQTVPKLPPPKPMLSPRSPSPIRNPRHTSLLRPDATRSVSAPGIASQILGSSKSSKDRPSGIYNPLLTPSLDQRNMEEQRKMAARERKETEESQALIDKEDESIQAFLSREIVGTKILDDFIAHQDYVGNADKDSIPAQVEAVYRDVNSMIDTLGINSVSLKSFLKGHEEQYNESGRTRLDLEDGEDWCLIEMSGLTSIVEKDLRQKLDQGRVKDVGTKLECCVELEKDLLRLRAKHDDIKRLLIVHSDPEHVATTRSQPLTAEQAVQQHDLRRDFTTFQKLLGEAEENLTVLRAKLSSQRNMNGRAPPGPTVEAVMRTITKMTQMAEKRSGDVDVLENQMRKLRLSSASNGGSREASPFATPAAKASTRPGTSSTYGLFYTPDSSKDTPRNMQTSLTSSVLSYGRATPPRRKMSGFTEDDKQQLKVKTARRKEVTDRLRTALQKSTVRIRPLDAD
jgi:nucleoporin NUP159